MHGFNLKSGKKPLEGFFQAGEGHEEIYTEMKLLWLQRGEWMCRELVGGYRGRQGHECRASVGGGRGQGQRVGGFKIHLGEFEIKTYLK